jgi:hypothetical protein
MADQAPTGGGGGGYSQAQMDELLRLMRKREADMQDAAAAAAKGAAGGGAMGGLPGALVGAGLSIATPFVTKALGGLFGVSDAEEEERQALDRAKEPFRAVAQGGTTQGQAGIAYARGRTLQDLASQTKRVSAQQLADTQAQYSAQLSDLRSREQERARAMLGSIEQLEAERAAKSAQRQRQALSQGIAGAVVPLAQQLLTPSAKTGLTAQEIADYNAQNTKGTAASGDFGASFTKRAAEMAAEANPYAEVESTTLTGNEVTGGGLAGGGVAGGQFGFDLANERAPNAANIASAGRTRSPNPAAALDTLAGAAPTVATSPMQDLASVQSSIAALPGPKPYGGSTFSAPEVMPSQMEKSIYKNQLVGPGAAGAAGSQDLGFAPIRSTGFGGMSTTPETTPEEPSRWRKYRGRRPAPIRGGGFGL